MTAFRRRAPSLLVALFVAACVSTVAPSASPSASPRASRPAPSLTPVPGGPSATPAATLPSTTQTEFGRIWDGLPDSFPRMARSTPADQPGPASAIFAATIDSETAVRQIRADLEDLGWTVDVGSPLEDGTVVLEATGPTPGCKAEVRFTPVSGTLIITVLYGASCPFE
ncbi:MAG TPA: hypothetical protein VGJ71_07460 [Candidatus Limnocylindrales bacterium]